MASRDARLGKMDRIRIKAYNDMTGIFESDEWQDILEDLVYDRLTPEQQALISKDDDRGFEIFDAKEQEVINLLLTSTIRSIVSSLRGTPDRIATLAYEVAIARPMQT